MTTDERLVAWDRMQECLLMRAGFVSGVDRA